MKLPRHWPTSGSRSKSLDLSSIPGVLRAHAIVLLASKARVNVIARFIVAPGKTLAQIGAISAAYQAAAFDEAATAGAALNPLRSIATQSFLPRTNFQSPRSRHQTVSCR